MPDLLTQDLISYDPLSEVTRKERRALLGLCVLGIALVKVPLVPEKFSTFGIEFARPNQKAFLAIYAAVLIYFLVAFLIYATTDYIAWRRARVRNHAEYTKQYVVSHVALGDKGQAMLADELQRKPRTANNDADLTYRGLASYRFAQFASRLRATFEFGVPVALTIYTVRILFTYPANGA